MLTHTADGGGGPGARISYDSEQTTHGMSKLKSDLDLFAEANDQTRSQMEQALGEMSGEAVEAYKETFEEYLQAAELVVQHMTTFIELMAIVNEQITGADERSANMLNE